MNPKSLSPDQVQRAENRLARVPGVLACRIRSDGGELREIQLDAAHDANPAEVRREVEAVLKRDLGLDVDPGLIRVSAREREEASGLEEFPILEFASRFAFVSVNVVSSREGLRAEVELSRDAAAAFGAASSDNIAAPAWSVIAEATLRAVSEFLDDATRLCLIGVVRAPLGDNEAMLVRVDVVSSRCTKSLAGCALVDGNENQSVVFATLDAVNRVTGKLDFKASVEYKIQ
jgi:hypothetical protein